MKNFVQRGQTLDVTAPYAVASGAGVKVGSIIGIAIGAIASGAVGTIERYGVFDVAKANETWAQGDKIYWDDTNKVFTKTATSNTLCGVAVDAVATAGNLVGRVYLDGAIR